RRAAKKGGIAAQLIPAMRSPSQAASANLESATQMLEEPHPPSIAPTPLETALPDDTAELEPTITSRADSVPKPKTMMPKLAGTFKLPPSSLLHRPDEQQSINEDELKDVATTLTDKLAEFDVLGQVTHINPGPVVTTFEFKPEAGKIGRASCRERGAIAGGG